jgi:hypothetical protein
MAWTDYQLATGILVLQLVIERLFIEKGMLVLASIPNNNPRLLEISLPVHFYTNDIQAYFESCYQP